MRNLRDDLALCQAATPGPWFTYRTASGTVTVQCPPGWICTMSDKGDMPTARFIAAAREGWPAAIKRALAAEERAVELEAALQLALHALTDGMEDVPPGHRSPQCAKLRAEAKRVIRQALEGTGK